MLKKDLLRFDCNSAQIFPRFVDTNDLSLKEFCVQLLTIYRHGIGKPQEEISGLTMPVIRGSRSPLTSRGLNKLLLDRCEFQKADDTLQAWRMEVFEASAKRMEDPNQDTLYSFRQQVALDLKSSAEEIEEKLYSDLPERQPLLTFEPLKPIELLQRYNMAQAQGLLFWAKQVRITFKDSNVEKRRQIFQYIKWFRLLVQIEETKKDSCVLILDGPLSIFSGVQKYGLKLAMFLPALTKMKEWTLIADIHRPNESIATLALDQTAELVSHYTKPEAYRPPALDIYAKEFAEAKSEWLLADAPQFLPLGEQEIAIPDLTFQNKFGFCIYLEIFHQWHATPLKQRLKWLDKQQQPPPLLIAVDRTLRKKAEIKKLLEKSPWYQHYGFSFNEFPLVNRTLQHLEQMWSRVVQASQRR
ncbi:DUF790 family protein [Magnetococcales bacterium HHB-1]